ncbi:MAG: M55 family metallopeptidase [Anaerolineaceae bacterium]|nr:M55 family metallopeptidase [Anaerolineaceae bacterium]
MKLLIAVDMEGISGITRWEQVNIHQTEYEYGRSLMVADVNAAVEGALEGGATEIQVSDGHWNGTNILLADLHPAARLHTGNVAPLAMVQGIQDGFDAVIFIGYHAMAGTANAIMDHTWSSKNIARLWINGELAGETALNSYLCGFYQTPVLAISGDQTVAAEAKALLPGIETAVVKTATSRESGICLALDEAHQIIHNTVNFAVKKFLDGKAPKPLLPPTPLQIKIEFMHSQMASRACYLPGTKRVDGRSVTYVAKDMPDAFFAFRTMSTIAND